MSIPAKNVKQQLILSVPKMLGLKKGNLKDTKSITDSRGSYPAFSRREMLSRPGTSEK